VNTNARRHFATLAGIAWSVTAFLIVTAAVTVTLVRLLLPQLGEYREELQAWVSDYVAQPVAIGTFEASWRGWTPELHLTDIRLLDENGERVITRFQSANLGVNLLASLRQQRLVPGKLVVSGVQLSLLRGRDGAIRIEGVDPAQTEMPGQHQNALADWLQNQRDLSVESATITWRDERTLIKPVVFSDVRLHIRSDGERRQLRGVARLPAQVGRRFEFRVDAEGDLLTTNWSGRMYVEGEAINPSILLNYQNLLGLRISEGRVGFRLWSEWREARLTALDGVLRAEDVALGVAGERGFTIAEAGGRLRAQRSADGRWALALRDLALRTRNGSWPESELALTLIPSAGEAGPALVGRAGFIRLDDIAPVLPGVEAIPANIRRAVAALAPRGELRDLRVGYFPARSPEERFYVHGEFAGVMTRPARGWPGVSGLRGTLRTDAAAGRLALDSESLQLDFPDRLEAPARLEHLRGGLRWQRRGEGWRLRLEALDISHAGLLAKLQGELDWRAGEAPHANLIAEFDRGEIEALRRLVPRELMPERGYTWVKEALQGGRITGGSGVLRGPIDAFPFDHSEGVFKLRFVVEDALLDFHRHWPRLEELDAELRFSGRGVEVTAPRARLLGLELTDTEVRIPDLAVRERRVEANGRVHGAAEDMYAVVAASPLERSLGERLSEFSVSGDLAIDLALTVPLRRGARPSSQGRLVLPGNQVQVRQPRLAFDAVEGSIRFQRGEWRSEEMNARYLGEPVQLALAGGRREGEAYGRYRMHGSAGVDLIRRQARDLLGQSAAAGRTAALLRRAQGKIDWEAELRAGAAAGGGRTLTVRSDLEGLALELPAPLGKPAGELRRLEVRMPLAGGDEPRLAIDYGNHVAAAVLLGPEAPRLRGAGVGLGGRPAPAPEPGVLRMAGHLQRLSLSEWLLLLDALQEAEDGGAAGAEAPAAAGPGLALEASVSLGELEALRRELGPVIIDVHAAGEHHDVELDGPGLAGSISVPAEPRPSTPVLARLERLHVGPRTQPPPRYVARPAAIPPLRLTSESTRFEDIELGRMQLRTVPQAQGLRLEQLRLEAEHFTAESSGEWLEVEGSHRCRFDIDVSGDDLGELLAAFGYDGAAIEGGDTELELDAAWTGTPAEFTLAKLEGFLRLEVEEGRLLDVDPKAGRLFGLLSLQSIKRRLSLDFGDLFRKGFSFDHIKGAFELDQGNAYTNNLSMAGPAARIQVSGRTGLAEQDYDQIVTVTPRLAGSLPVASALFGPAGAGVGAVLFIGQKMFKSLPDQLDKMLARQYVVTGEWRDPVVEQVSGLDLSFGG